MKKSMLFLLSMVGMLLVFAGSIWAETTSQYPKPESEPQSDSKPEAETEFSLSKSGTGGIDNSGRLHGGGMHL